ncbi:cytochrome P450 [Haladaptatus sp. AB618]|uniref:cytochrome P450 n=1 Tax=Haladaptatus sp. AB618 TaxID=2934173 RepID=UPI00209BE62C|nr:cytochrome P450 [Haladaptatus sp. AB618]MCO8254907.1 cytochrome P450 [Haladaptatus sp. AB618]
MQSTDPVAGKSELPEAIRSRNGQLEPFEWYAEMRQRSPVHFDEQRQQWDLFQYEEVNHVLTDYESFTANRSGSENVTDDDGAMFQTMIMVDPPGHERLRGFVNERFQPGTLREYRPRIEELTEEVLDQIDGKDRFDFVDEFAIRLPITIIAELLGIPVERRDEFKEWSDALVARPEDGSEASIKRSQERTQWAQQQMGQYFAQLLEERQDGSGDDLITLAATSEELSRGEQIGFCMLLLVAGNITTTNLLTNALWCFEERGMTDAIRTGEIDRKQAIEEVLRYRSPIQSLDRVALEDVELNGHKIREGDVVTAWLGAANRDPELFDAPEEFRPERRPNRHIAFGKGVHYCLGAPLARIEADVAFEVLLDRFETIEADLTDLQPLYSLYGLESLTCTIEE